MTPLPLLYSVALCVEVTLCISANNTKRHSVKKGHSQGGITTIFVEDCRMLIEGHYHKAH